MIAEILGYVGMAITLYAFTRKKQTTLRKFTLIGAFLTTLNCILTANVPVAILNGSLVLINAVALWKEKYHV